MGRIEDTQRYPIDETVTGNDYVIGTDADGVGNRTKNYQVSDILALGGIASEGITGTFRHVVLSPGGNYTGNVLIYADGVLVATLANGQEAIVDLSKTLLFVADGGISPIFELTYQDGQFITVFALGFPATTQLIKLSKEHYENLEDAVLNGYAVITTYDVS